MLKQIGIVVVFVLSLISCRNENQELLDQVTLLENKVDSMQKAYNDIDIEHMQKIYTDVSKKTDYLYANYQILVERDSSSKKYIQSYRNLAKRLNRSFKRGGSNLGADINIRSKQLKDLKYDIINNILTDSVEIKEFIDIETKALVQTLNVGKVIMSQFKLEEEHYYILKDSVEAIIEKSGLIIN